MRKRKDRSEFPIAAVAFSGPDDQKAAKTVTGIMYSADDDAPLVKRWCVDDKADIRDDRKVMAEPEKFLEEHGVKTGGGLWDRMIGCPHEEGIDCPAGEKCPVYPFRANRDRWTGEILDDED